MEIFNSTNGFDARGEKESLPLSNIQAHREPSRPILSEDKASLSPVFDSVAGIEAKMKNFGFPELERHWKIFKGLSKDIKELDPAVLAESFQKHCTPNLSRPYFVNSFLVLFRA